MAAAGSSGDRTLTVVVGVGYLGQRVLDAAATGTVVGLSRSAHATLPMVETLDLDAGGPLPLTLPDPYRVLYTVPPAGGDGADTRLAHLLAALDPAPAAFVYISTTGVYGDRGGAVVTEADPVRPENERSQRRVDAEAQLETWCTAHGSRLCILRVPGIYGPGRLGVERIRSAQPVIDERDANPGNRIHVDDLVACCIAALQTPEAVGIINVGDGDHRSSTQFIGEVARQAGLPAPPAIRFETAKRKFSAMRLSFLSESRRIDTTRMREVLGVVPVYADPAAGIAASLAIDDESG